MSAKAPKVLFIATNGFENSELFEPRQALIDAGAAVTLASLSLDPIQGTIHDEKADLITPDALIADMAAADFDALVLPGGVSNPDRLRTDEKSVQLIRDFASAGKPVAAICHGPWLLAEAAVVDGRTVATWPSIRTDLRNAGAIVVDQDVAVDGNLITSRMPEDIPAFNREILKALGLEPAAD
jgi:protease I